MLIADVLAEQAQDQKAAAGEIKKQMSNEMMEALVVKKIAGLRASEAMFALSLHAVRSGATVDLSAAQQRMQAQLQDVERLLAALDTTPESKSDALPVLVAAAAAKQIQPTAWV